MLSKNEYCCVHLRQIHSIHVWKNCTRLSLELRMDSCLFINCVKEQCDKLKEKHQVLLVPCQYIVVFMDCIVNNEDNFQIRLCTIVIQEIRTIVIDHMPRRMYSMLALNFQHLSLSLTSLQNEKSQFKVGFRMYLHVHSFYFGHEFLVFKNGVQYLI